MGALAAPLAWAAERPLELPPPHDAPPLLVGSAPQLELAAYTAALLSDQTPATDTPPRAAAYEEATALTQSPAVKLARELEPAGLGIEALYRLLLTHSPPPELVQKLKLELSRLPAPEASLQRDRKADLKRLLEGLRRLYKDGELEELIERHARMQGSVARVYQNVFPGAYPASELHALAGEAGPVGTVVLAPSLLAQKPARFAMPLEAGTAPLRFSVLPIGEEGVPDTQTAALTRYEEVAGWVLEPMFHRFRGELAEVSGSGPAAAPQLIRALYLHEQSIHNPDLARAARDRSSASAFPLLAALEQELREWEGLKSRYRTLSEFLPELLDHASLVSEGKSELPRLADPGFERWSGAVPEVWKLEVVEPAQGSPRPSNLTRVKGEARGSWALMLSGDARTNEWQGVMSEPLPVLPGDRVVVTGRMKSRNVAPGLKRVTAAHLEARALKRDGTVLRRVTGRELVGTNPWETVKLEFVVPAGADRLQIGCVLAMVGELYFDDIGLKVERPPVRRFLVNGGFETASGNAPSGWETAIAYRQTQSGPTIASRWELVQDTPVEGRAFLKLAGDNQTSQWLELRSMPVAVSPGQRVVVSGRMAAKNIQLGPRQHRHANLTLTFLNERGLEIQTVESPVLEGSRDWGAVELDIVAPQEALAVRVGCLLTMSGELWFDDLHLHRR